MERVRFNYGYVSGAYTLINVWAAASIASQNDSFFPFKQNMEYEQSIEHSLKLY